jgi:crotonobetainyl-CoA:carnitine CoA-transferase CaiB-like acyl-CoA transferase
MTLPKPHALEGVRVLDLSRVLAGPWCGQLLGDLGADVIKIETPGRGDDTRAWGPPFLPPADPQPGNPRGESAYYLSANRNKRSAAIDFSRPEGAALIRQLAAKADIILENFKVGGLKKYGLDYDSIRAVNPRAVYCSITGFGQYGPYKDRGGYDFVAQGMGGIMSITGQPDGSPGAGPMKAGVAICDLFTGIYAATAVLAALRHAERTGEGQWIDCALLDTQVAMLANQGMSYLVGNVVATRMGNAHPTVVPYRPFACKDGSIIIAVGNDRQFKDMCAVIGRPDVGDDPRYASNTLRIQNRGSLEASMEEAIAALPVRQLSDALVAKGVPVGPINAIDQVFADAQVKARGVTHTLARADGVEVPGVGYPPQLSLTPPDYRRPPPRLGEHTFAVLREELGLAEEDIQTLRDAGVIEGF